MKYLLLSLIILNFTLLFSQSQGPLSGATFANVAIGGSNASWNNTGRVVSSNNSSSIANNSLSSGEYTDYLKVTNFGFTIPSGATIDGILVEIEYFDNGTSNRAKDNRVRIVKGGIIGSTDMSLGATWPTVDPNSYTSYGDNVSLWGETWIDTDINSSTFGFAISAKRSGGTGNSFPAIDHIRITVYYTTSLPIELLSFNCRGVDNEYVIVDWVTASETNNDYFTIERSDDAIYFVNITTIPGSGNSTSIKTYNIRDLYPNKGINYYRLRQTDYDGKTEVSSTIAVNIIKYLEELKVIKITNLIGQEVTEYERGVLIFYFNDGTCIKKYSMK